MTTAFALLESDAAAILRAASRPDGAGHYLVDESSAVDTGWIDGMSITWLVEHAGLGDYLGVEPDQTEAEKPPRVSRSLLERVAGLLASRMNKDAGYSWALSVREIAAFVGHSRRQVHRVLNEMERIGVLRRTPQKWRISTYTMDYPRLVELARAKWRAVKDYLAAAGAVLARRGAQGSADASASAAGDASTRARTDVSSAGGADVSDASPSPRRGAQGPHDTDASPRGRGDPEVAARIVAEVLGKDLALRAGWSMQTAAGLYRSQDRPPLDEWRADWEVVASAMVDPSWRWTRGYFRGKGFGDLMNAARATTRAAQPPPAPSWSSSGDVWLPTGQPRGPCAPDVAARWDDVLESLRAAIGDEDTAVWMARARPVGVRDDGVLVLQVPNHHFAEWITENLLGPLTHAVGGPVAWTCRATR